MQHILSENLEQFDKDLVTQMLEVMVRDSITEEIREIRHRLAEKFDNDVDRIDEDLRPRGVQYSV
ncbi:MAG: hypothetical protein WCJ35_16265 [Planctomycetota bacterium]